MQFNISSQSTNDPRADLNAAKLRNALDKNKDGKITDADLDLLDPKKSIFSQAGIDAIKSNLSAWGGINGIDNSELKALLQKDGALAQNNDWFNIKTTTHTKKATVSVWDSLNGNGKDLLSLKDIQKSKSKILSDEGKNFLIENFTAIAGADKKISMNEWIKLRDSGLNGQAFGANQAFFAEGHQLVVTQDANGDGHLNVADTQFTKKVDALAKKFGVETTEIQKDINGDGAVNTKDVALFKQAAQAAKTLKLDSAADLLKDTNGDGKVQAKEVHHQVNVVRQEQAAKTIINEENNQDQVVKTGKGSDSVTLDGNNAEKKVKTHAGNDSVILSGDTTKNKVNTGRGSDTVTVAGSAAESKVKTGRGNDTVDLQENLSKSKVKTGQGKDTVTVGGTGNRASVETGNGKDTISVSNTGITKIKAGKGNDEVKVSATAGKVTVNGGAGKKDTLELEGKKEDWKYDKKKKTYTNTISNTVVTAKNIEKVTFKEKEPPAAP